MTTSILPTVIEWLFKAVLFLPLAATVYWWLDSGARQGTLNRPEAAIGFTLLGVGISFGAISLVLGGWGYVGVLGIIYLVLLALSCKHYIHLKRMKMLREVRLFAEIDRYLSAIQKDPTKALNYSYLGQTYLKLNHPEEAAAALQKALELDPDSSHHRNLLEQAEELKKQQD